VRNADWIYQHLYNPRVIVNDSNCPPMPHLFELVDRGAASSSAAVAVVGNRQLVPTTEARNLAAYLLSLNRSHALSEAPPMGQPTEAKK
jgi:cbb3-type cytochrome oxidase cytochrome c subunit